VTEKSRKLLKSWQEVFAVVIVLLILVGLPAVVIGYRYAGRDGTDGGVRVFDLTAQVPEAGGWQPETITVRQGDRVRLRIHGADVVHGFAIGRTDVAPVRVEPGKVATVEFVADQAGEFAFYCDVWCSPFHYRMRGTLEVLAPDGTLPVAPSTVTEQRVNAIAGQLDEPHPARFYPTVKPSALQGRRLAVRYGDVLAPWRNTAALRDQSPSDVYAALLPSTGDLSSQDRWGLIAYLWATTTTPERLATGQALYERNCAACHDVKGTGRGPAWRYLKDEPQSFADATTMAGGTSWNYYAKIVRGGMGTGMPYFGKLFTEEQTWSLADYLWTFLFAYDTPKEKP